VPTTTYGTAASNYGAPAGTSFLRPPTQSQVRVAPGVAATLPATTAVPYGNVGAYPATATTYDINGLPIQAPAPINEPLMPVTGVGQVPFSGYSAEPTYLYPGLVRQYLGQWVGSDYLFNMSANIGVVVEIVAPSDIPNTTFNTDEIKQNVSEIFANGGINPYAEAFLEQPPLPFFHIIILVAQVEESYVFSISGRFFEAAKIPRLNFKKPGKAQVITWEKQELVTTSQSRFSEQLILSAREIADFFIQRINYFNRQRLEQDAMLKMRCGPAPTAKCPPRLKAMGSKPAF
jgi:hypothetical protein